MEYLNKNCGFKGEASKLLPEPVHVAHQPNLMCHCDRGDS